MEVVLSNNFTLISKKCLISIYLGMYHSVGVKNRKEWFIINSEGLPYTEQMDHAFRGVHGFGYDELRSSQALRMKVEKRRQRDYEKSVQVVARIDAKAFRG